MLRTFRATAARRMCLAASRGCRRPGILLRLTANASFRVTGTLFRGSRRLGVLRMNARNGARSVRFARRTSDRKRLKAGRYRLVLRGAGVIRTLRFAMRAR